MLTPKQPVINAVLITYIDYSITENYRVAQKKERVFFSNNCNFVYFQYKKIMLTPKQPVINAVLITYIDYSITEYYRVAQKERILF